MNALKPDPMLLVSTILHWTTKVATEYGIQVETSLDFARFSNIRRMLRAGDPNGEYPSPYFDPRFNSDTLENDAFWILGKKDGEPVFLDAYCLYEIKGPFRAWVEDWLISFHTRIGEDISLEVNTLPESAMSARISGKTVYRGEFWLRQDLRPNGRSSMLDDLSRLGMALSWLYHQPEYVWGLTVANKARAGIMNRVAFCYTEPDFIIWQPGKRPLCVETDREMLVVTPTDQILNQIQPDHVKGL